MKFIAVSIVVSYCIQVCSAFTFLNHQVAATHRFVQTDDFSHSDRNRIVSGILRNTLSASIACGISFMAAQRVYADAGADTLVDLLATMLEAQQIIQPTKEYVEQQAYDVARFNIQFVLNQLQLQRKVTALMRTALESIDDENILERLEDAGARITNTAIQYDSTVYTCVFIPTVNGEVPPSAEKYRRQAQGFYEQFMAETDALLAAGTAEQLTAARKLAAQRLTTYPSVLFKSTSPNK